VISRATFSLGCFLQFAGFTGQTLLPSLALDGGLRHGFGLWAGLRWPFFVCQYLGQPPYQPENGHDDQNEKVSVDGGSLGKKV